MYTCYLIPPFCQELYTSSMIWFYIPRLSNLHLPEIMLSKLTDLSEYYLTFHPEDCITYFPILTYSLLCKHTPQLPYYGNFQMKQMNHKGKY